MSLKSNLLGLLLLLCNILFSQGNEYPIVTKIEKDSVIIFTIQQGRELVKINEQRKECLEINDILNKEMIQKDTIIYSQSKKIQNYEAIMSEKDKIIIVKDEQVQICEQEKTMLKKELRKQKVGKWIAIAGGVAIGVLGIVF